MTDPKKDWNTNEDFFRFSRGRFICDEDSNMLKRSVRFDMNQLARIAAESITAKNCTNVQKCADGMYNKSYLFTMDDGRQVIGKVPNPNAGLPHFTTASEVATMDFVRNILGTPAPHVYAWNSRAENSVGIEYIIMEKIQGVQLLHVWDQLKLTEKLEVVTQLFKFQKTWLSVRFAQIGSLYYANDIETSAAKGHLFTDSNGKEVRDERFVVGPTTGRDWIDEDRSLLNCDRGPWTSISDFYQAALRREIDATKTARRLPKQMVMLCAPTLYQPTHEKKLAALESATRIVQYLIPSDPLICASHIWHNDLHDENIFVDPQNPTKITGIIDWQSTQVAPLFENTIDPGILDYDGPPIESLQQPVLPEDFNKLSGVEKAAELKLFYSKALLVAYRRLIQKNMPLKRTSEFQESTAFNILKLSRRIFEIGEAHCQAIISRQLEAEWNDLTAVHRHKAQGPCSFPLSFTEPELQQIESDAEAADAGIQAMDEIRRRLGSLWPEKGAVQVQDYDETKRAGSATAKQRRKQKVVLESNSQGQNGERCVLSFTADPPHGYTFIPAGNPQLTNALKEEAARSDSKIMSVSTTPHASRHELSRVVHRVGYHFPTEVVSRVCAMYGIRLDSRGRLIKEKGHDDDKFMRVYQNGELVLNENVRSQTDINTEAKEIIQDLFPKIPDKDLFQIIKTAFQLGDGKVGTADEIPLVRRAQLSVVAHIRHVYTDYDKRIKRMPYNEARHAVEADTLKKLVEWTGDDDAQNEKKRRAVEDIFREVIVLSDDEASDSEGDDAAQLMDNDLRVEELPSNAYAPAPLRPASPHHPYPAEEVVQGYRIVEAPVHRYPAREVDYAARDHDRFVRWEQARQQYRTLPIEASSVYEQAAEPVSTRRLIPLDPPTARVVEREYLGPMEDRVVDNYQASQPRYERAVGESGYSTPPLRSQIHKYSPVVYSGSGSRPMTPVKAQYRIRGRTPPLEIGDTSVLPSIEGGPHGRYSPSSVRQQYGSTRPEAYPLREDRIDFPSSTDRPSRYRQLEDSHIPRDVGLQRREIDPRERSPLRSHLHHLEPRIIEVAPPHSMTFTPDGRYREVEYPTPRRVLIPEPTGRSNAGRNDGQFDGASSSYTRILEPLSPQPREHIIRRVVYPEDAQPAVESLHPRRGYESPTSFQSREYALTSESFGRHSQETLRETRPRHPSIHSQMMSEIANHLIDMGLRVLDIEFLQIAAPSCFTLILRRMFADPRGQWTMDITRP
ncbi:hypothetical protein DV735_g2766, partial [Chaetothyriales sp. CBS 134920]